ncbi:RCC1 domain-containing protein [Paenibacillus sp. FSL H8-0104]|uniref:RCC1 domain-containing protein n=1 Tax=Paenibacillus sp. FSL H8-0104 TaxID=2954509 RepID=UPI0030FD2710
MDNTETKDRKKYTIRVGWKRSLIVTLVIALLVGTYSFADFGPKAQAAEYVKVDSVTPYTDAYSGPTVGYSFNMNDGSYFQVSSWNFYIGTSFPAGVKKAKALSGPNNIYLTDTGELWSGSPAVKVLDNVKDFEVMAENAQSLYTSYFALMNDGTVLAWGKGTSGQLGIGYKQDKTVPTEVIDPETGDPMEGVKKIISSASDNLLLIKDGSVYMVGNIFLNTTSFTTAAPVKMNAKFPAFTTADQFEMKAVENRTALREGNHFYGNSFGGSQEASRRVFVINGKSYSLTNFFAYDKRDIYYGWGETYHSQGLIELPADIKVENLVKMGAYSFQSYSKNDLNVSTGYLNLDQGKLEYWGTTFASWGKLPANFSSTRMQIATGVEKVQGTGLGTIMFRKSNGNLYVSGTNYERLSGTSDTLPAIPIRVTGPENQIKNIKDFGIKVSTSSYSDKSVYALQEDGTMLTWNQDGAVTTLPDKYLSMYTMRQNEEGLTEILAIREDGALGRFDRYSTKFVPYTNSPVVYPADYVVPVTKPETPVLTTTSQDKFDQFSVSINYGTSADLTVKEYQINSKGWTPYTGEFVVTDTGSVRILARSADSKGNISDEGVLQIVSNPIVIDSGEPNVTKVSANEFKVSAKATGAVKTQVRVDGAAWQNHNVANSLLLDPGSHTIDVRLLNAKDEELINKSFTVTADDPTPVIIAKPIVTQTGLNSTYGLNLDVQFDSAAGEAQYSVDGGTWTATTGTISVLNGVHTVRVKVVAIDGKESEVVDFVTTKVDPKVEFDNGDFKIDIGVIAPTLKNYYKDNVNGVWTEYTGPVTYPPGTYTFDVEIREDASGDVVYVGGPFTLVVPDPNTGNPGNGGTTPTPNPGTGTPVGQEDVDFTVNSGGLSAKFEGADLSTIIIDSTNPYQSINSVSRVLIEDSRGNGKGYQYSMDVTDFVSESMQDNSTNTQGLVVSIPANALSVDVLNTKTINGPAAELSNVGKHVFTGTGPEMLATAKAFEGMGYNEIPLNFTLSVPDRVKIVSSGTGSKFVPGESTGLMAGIYKSRFTITLSSGI